MTRDRTLYIRHIHDLIARIDDYTAEGEEAFKRDSKTQDAVLHNLTLEFAQVLVRGANLLISLTLENGATTDRARSREVEIYRS